MRVVFATNLVHGEASTRISRVLVENVFIRKQYAHCYTFITPRMPVDCIVATELTVNSRDHNLIGRVDN